MSKANQCLNLYNEFKSGLVIYMNNAYKKHRFSFTLNKGTIQIIDSLHSENRIHATPFLNETETIDVSIAIGGKQHNEQYQGWFPDSILEPQSLDESESQQEKFYEWYLHNFYPITVIYDKFRMKLEGGYLGKVQTNDSRTNVLVESIVSTSKHYSPHNQAIGFVVMSEQEIQEAYLKHFGSPSLQDMKKKLQKIEGFAISNCTAKSGEHDYDSLVKYDRL